MTDRLHGCIQNLWRLWDAVIPSAFLPCPQPEKQPKEPGVQCFANCKTVLLRTSFRIRSLLFALESGRYGLVDDVPMRQGVAYEAGYDRILQVWQSQRLKNQWVPFRVLKAETVKGRFSDATMLACKAPVPPNSVILIGDARGCCS